MPRDPNFRDFSYESGYSSSLTSSTTTDNGVRTTRTTSVAMNVNNPVSEQMQALLIHAPRWVTIISLDFSARIADLGGVKETRDYLVKVKAKVPVEK